MLIKNADDLIIADHYDPRITSLLDQAVDDWGKPEDNRKNLIPYGFKEFDEALYGIKLHTGELIQTIGERKNRKTTLWINIVANYMMHPTLPKVKPLTVWDALESAMPPKRVRDVFIANVATRFLIKWGHKYGEFCPECGTARCEHMGISADFLVFHRRTEEQYKAINAAIQEMRKWPLLIYGPAVKEGSTRNLEKARKRWKHLINAYGATIFVVDHLQQYDLPGMKAFEKQEEVINTTGATVGEHKVVFSVLSQVSLTSVREAKQGMGEIKAAGGDRGSQEANTEFITFYDSTTNEMRVQINASRNSANFALEVDLEPASGAVRSEPRRVFQPLN